MDVLLRHKNTVHANPVYACLAQTSVHFARKGLLTWLCVIDTSLYARSMLKTQKTLYQEVICWTGRTVMRAEMCTRYSANDDVVADRF
jgi:hypothetical protein